MRLIDSHIHLNAEQYSDILPALLQRARGHSIDAWIIPGTTIEGISSQLAVSKTYQNCFNAFGVHPWFLASLPEDWKSILVAHIEKYHPVAIGECGLDFSREAQALQLKVFEAQVILAEKYQLPLIIHSYKAVDLVLKILRKYPNITGVFHGFNGSLQQLSQVLDLGFHVGFGGAITYDRAHRMRQLLKAMPLERLLIETDGPFQAGSYRQKGDIHLPEDLLPIAKCIAEQKSLELIELATITAENAMTLFNLEIR